MARFKYLGESARSWITAYGPCTVIQLPKQDGTTDLLTPISPATSFEINVDIGYNITDERSLRIMRNDPRFQEI